MVPLAKSFILTPDLQVISSCRTLYQMVQTSTSPTIIDKGVSRQELIRTANLLFVQLDSGYMWSFCARSFLAACQDERRVSRDEVLPVGTQTTNILEMCKLVPFLLEVISVETYVENSLEHLPRLFQVN